MKRWKSKFVEFLGVFRRIKEDFRIVKEGFKDVWSSPPYRWYFRVMVILTILTILYAIEATIMLTVR